ncbi:MAG: hypothetical protein PHH38_05000, partial [Candidatus Cloacimonetes bacterium]|nr:hypothetical protein [Candidatus Cloacimonadota bacterium]
GRFKRAPIQYRRTLFRQGEPVRGTGLQAGLASSECHSEQSSLLKAASLPLPSNSTNSAAQTAL